MVGTEHFVNAGFGWTCKPCAAEFEARGNAASDEAPRARFMTEGEAEGKDATLSSLALARWRDAARQTLFCPRCGIEERVNKA